LFYLSAISLGLALGAMCIGLFISLRIFNFPDITTDGSYTLGGVITAVGLVEGWSMASILILVISAGAVAGMATGILHTKLKLNSLLSGILVMTGLYSVNLAILGKSNLPLTRGLSTIFSFFQLGGATIWNQLVVLALVLLLIILGITLMLKTDFGLAMRATGNNPIMARSLGISSNWYKIMGLAIANSLVAVSGYLVVQLQGFADINMGIGVVILGLGAVMIGESISHLLNIKSLAGRLVGVIAGSIVFRLILSLALSMGIDPVWLKLLTASIVVLIVGLPNLLPGMKHRILND